MVSSPLSSEDIVVAFFVTVLPLSDEVGLSVLDGEDRDSVDVFIVESSGAGVKTPLISVDGVRDDIDEKSHGGIMNPRPLGP